ncbi:MAG: NADH-quinone oxidoreductase subunit F, partial [Planctomycetes bacterium]|nr:NADH-quinone oxidoreductase subunit F [Planctomycetota bacterium]
MFVCASNGSVASRCNEVKAAVSEDLKSHGLDKEVQIVPTGCMGLCSHGPLIRAEVQGQDPVLYTEMDDMLARLMVAEYLE